MNEEEEEKERKKKEKKEICDKLKIERSKKRTTRVHSVIVYHDAHDPAHLSPLDGHERAVTQCLHTSVVGLAIRAVAFLCSECVCVCVV